MSGRKIIEGLEDALAFAKVDVSRGDLVCFSSDGRPVRIRFERVPGERFMAVSDDMPGLLVAGASVPDLTRVLPQAIAELEAATG